MQQEIKYEKDPTEYWLTRNEYELDETQCEWELEQIKNWEMSRFPATEDCT